MTSQRTRTSPRLPIPRSRTSRAGSRSASSITSGRQRSVRNPPAITVNKFGKGRAVYVATPAQPQIMRPLLRQLMAELGIARGPVTPDGVFARVVQGRVFYVNTTGAPVDLPIAGAMNGLLSGKRFEGTLRLEARGAELVEK